MLDQASGPAFCFKAVRYDQQWHLAKKRRGSLNTHLSARIANTVPALIPPASAPMAQMISNPSATTNV